MIKYWKADSHGKPTKITQTHTTEGAMYKHLYHMSGNKAKRGDWVTEIWNFFNGKTLVEERHFLKRGAEIIANYISAQEPELAYLSGKMYMEYLRQEAYANRQEAGYSMWFNGMLEMGVAEGVYRDDYLKFGFMHRNFFYADTIDIQNSEEGYFAQKIEKSGRFQGKTTFAGAKVIEAKYLGRSKEGKIFETLEERLFAIAMYLSKNETDRPMTKTLQFYDVLVQGKVVLATPTFMNAGRTYGQLSSCFIETMDDNLTGIYHTVSNSAENSKGGGGISVYMGKIRSSGNAVRNVAGASKGVPPWMRLLNDTAIAVDQTGARQGAIAVYLDVWHRDIVTFLESGNVNGDERMKSHDLFIGVTLPDLFMSRVQERADWYLFDPKEVADVMGFAIEDSFDRLKYDASLGLLPSPVDHAFSYKYGQCIDAYEKGKLKLVERLPAIEIMKIIMKQQLETGRPYMFYRDTANRANTMKDGMIYSSNLCTEIMQNMSASSMFQSYVDTEHGKVIKTYTQGDYVVCNLSSLNLTRFTFGHANKKGELLGRNAEFNRLKWAIRHQVRMLDNVIDLNELPVPEAQMTNKAYRPIGAGTMGKHTYLSNLGIRWEQGVAVEEMERIYEKIAFYTIEASMMLAKEKGAFPKFAESKWADGSWFDEHGLTSKRWQRLKKQVMEHGIRNAYLMAVAPNATISHVVGVSPSHDPAFKRFFVTEKKGIRTPNIAGGLTRKNYWFFKDAWLIDQKKSITQTARIQRFVDQGISHNIYVASNIHARDLLDLHLTAWKKGLKSTYYVRAQDTEAEDCESCAV